MIAWMRRRFAVVIAATGVCLFACPARADAVRMLDAFDDLAPWRAIASDDVSAAVTPAVSSDGKALRLEFDFKGRAGYASARRSLPLELPGNFEISFRLRARAKANDFQVKFLDASGDNVWWFRRPDFEFPPEWQTVRIRRRQVEFAWGPAADHTLQSIASLEFTVSAGRGGGAGAIEIAALTIRPLPLPPTTWPAPTATAADTAVGSDARLAIDGDDTTAWRSGRVREDGTSLTIDFAAQREFGGITLRWLDGHEATDYELQYSDDGVQWAVTRSVRRSAGGEHALYLPDSSARFVRLRLHAGRSGEFALREFVIEPLAFGASANDFFAQIARRAPRGAFPRAYVGEQSYWTLVGTDGGANEGLLSEDGAFELRRAAPSLEPLLRVDGQAYNWANVTAQHSLRDRYLPMPSVTWTTTAWRLETKAFGVGSAGGDYAVLRYEYTNTTARPQTVALTIAIRPLQVNPPTQFLNGAGGVATIRGLDWDGRSVRINSEIEVIPLLAPDRFTAATFDAAPTPDRLPPGVQGPTHLRDDFGYASGAFVYDRKVPAHASMTVAFIVPWTAEAIGLPERSAVDSWLRDREEEVVASWQAALNRVTLQGPPTVQPVFDTMRTALAHILINRDGVGLQPGSRSYERSWIRDGALSSEALIRLGHEPVARGFLNWYSGFLFANGKVPCCVDFRGADPVPENDSNGEFIWLAAELDRYTRDRAALDAVWPQVVSALGYLDELRLSERTPANLSTGRRALYGLMPASISHEGYSAKPMHSYWDDFWALAGLKSGVRLAGVREDPATLARLTASSEEFRTDLYASLAAATAQHDIDYLPGAAELGDFDATSTTIALTPVGETARLPQALLYNTFERYWREFSARRSGEKPSPAYTPYEIRTIGSFVRLGWRERANELLEFFMNDRRPAGWNQWAEVVGTNPREPRFIGDMPHGWVASDFIRSVLDMLAHERESDEALVLAAGIDARWLDGPGLVVDNLRTPWGRLSYSLRREDGSLLRLRIAAGVTPPGGVVLALGGSERRFAQLPVDVTIPAADAP